MIKANAITATSILGAFEPGAADLMRKSEESIYDVNMATEYRVPPPSKKKDSTLWIVGFSGGLTLRLLQ